MNMEIDIQVKENGMFQSVITVNGATVGVLTARNIGQKHGADFDQHEYKYEYYKPSMEGKVKLRSGIVVHDRSRGIEKLVRVSLDDVERLESATA